MDSAKTFEATFAEIEEKPQVKSIAFFVDDSFRNALPSAIISNFDEVMAFVEQQTENDLNLVLTTDEDFEAAEKRCAELNKLKQNIDAQRKEVKKAWNAPYTEFEDKCKKLTERLDAAKDNLWGQVQSSKQKVKDEKEATYKAYWDKLNAERLGGYRTWAQIFDKTWLNKGKRREAVFAELDKIFEGTVADITTLRGLESEFETVLIKYYKDGHSLNETMAYALTLQNEKKRLEALKTQQAQASAPIQPKQTAQAENQAYSEPYRATEQEQNVATDTTDQETVAITFTVETTRAKFQALAEFLRNNGIKYYKA